MKYRWLQGSIAGLLAMSAWLTVSPQSAQAQVIGIAAGVWGWRNIVAPQFGGPWVAPDVRFRPLADLREDGWYHEGTPAPTGSIRVWVSLPDENAEVWVQGKLMPMKGRARLFVSPPVLFGQTYSYEIRARWERGDQMIEETRTVPVRPNERVNVDFTRPLGK